MNIIDKLKNSNNSSHAKYVLSIVPEEILDDDSDFVKIFGVQYGQTKKEIYTIDKLYFSHKVKSIITNALHRKTPIRILCIRPNPMLKPTVYKVHKIQTQDNESHDWIDIKNISKIF
jgi:hypothetical protein